MNTVNPLQVKVKDVRDNMVSIRNLFGKKRYITLRRRGLRFGDGHYQIVKNKEFLGYILYLLYDSVLRRCYILGILSDSNLHILLSFTQIFVFR